MEEHTNVAQDQYGGHFGLGRDSVQNAANRMKDGARQALDRK